MPSNKTKKTHRVRRRLSRKMTRTMPNIHDRYMEIARSSLGNTYNYRHGIHNSVASILMRGGMNNYSNISNSSFINNYPFPNIESYTGPPIDPPWSPMSNKELTIGTETFVVSEYFEVSENGIGHFYINIGSSRRPNCIVSLLSSDTDYKIANIQGLSYYPSCSKSGMLPGNGVGAKMLMSAKKQYLYEHSITTGSTSDSARKRTNGKYEYNTSDHYFLSHGEPYYHRYRFYPDHDLELYVIAIIRMKKCTWQNIRAYNMNTELIKRYEEIALSCNPDLTYDTLAVHWFSAIWAMDEDYLAKTNQTILSQLAQMFGMKSTDPSISLLWYGELYTNEDMNSRVNEILAKYPADDRKLFTTSIGGATTKCLT